MKVQRLFTLMLVFFILSTATVVASSIWGDFEGYSKATVIVNGETQYFSNSDVPGFIVNNTTVLPLRTIADSLQALVKWDSGKQTATLFKPNVHMMMFHDFSKDFSTLNKPFGVVGKGETIDFMVFS
jgi:hypothetical protein